MPPKTIGLRLELDAELQAMLEELSDFHGVDIQARCGCAFGTNTGAW